MILALQLSHFSAAFLVAICASTVFGITQRNLTANNGPSAMLRYAGYCFIWFIFLGLFAAGWLMWLLHH
jgi:TRAP-type C4-dicarboxylate transport system permease small subunit